MYDGNDLLFAVSWFGNGLGMEAQIGSEWYDMMELNRQTEEGLRYFSQSASVSRTLFVSSIRSFDFPSSLTFPLFSSL